MVKKLISIMAVMLLVVSMSVAASACAIDGGSVSAAPGTVKVFVTDAPPEAEITAIRVTVSSIRIHQAVAEQQQQQTGDNTTAGSGNATAGSGNQTQQQEQEQQNSDGWITLEIGEGLGTFDLLQVQGISQFFADGQVAAGKYTQIRLVVDQAEVDFGDNETVTARIPSGELKLVHPFDVVSGETVSMLLDFDAEKSINITGSGEVIFKPVVKIITEPGDMANGNGQSQGKSGDKGQGSAADNASGNGQSQSQGKPEDNGQAAAATGRDNAAGRGQGNSGTGNSTQ